MSTGMEWTPGPWQVTQCRNGIPYVNIFRVSGPSDGTAPCTILFETKYETARENRANACLIAAAPDMYDALDTCSKLVFNGTRLADIVPAIPAALAKARGETIFPVRRLFDGSAAPERNTENG